MPPDPRHIDRVERLDDTFYIRWTSGPDYERAFICVEDDDADMNDIAAVPFGRAHEFKRAYLLAFRPVRGSFWFGLGLGSILTIVVCAAFLRAAHLPYANGPIVVAAIAVVLVALAAVEHHRNRSEWLRNEVEVLRCECDILREEHRCG